MFGSRGLAGDSLRRPQAEILAGPPRGSASSAAMANGTVYELEYRILRSGGSVRWVYDRAHPHLDPQGKMLRYVGAT